MSDRDFYTSLLIETSKRFIATENGIGGLLLLVQKSDVRVERNAAGALLNLTHLRKNKCFVIILNLQGLKLNHYTPLGLSVGSHILSGLFLTNHWVKFNNILHETSIPRGECAYHKGLTIACYFTELWPCYLLRLVGRKPYFVRRISYKPLDGIQ